MRIFKIEVATKMERNLALSKVKDIIMGCEGWIVDHQLFSNVSANINFELPKNFTEKFISKLKTSSFNPIYNDDFSKKGEGDIRCSITLTFIHNDPALKRDVPAFG